MALRTVRNGTVGLAVAGALTVACLASPAAADSVGHQPTQAALDAAVRAGVPGATAEVRQHYAVWMGTSGTGDVTTGQPRTAIDRYRVGSITKTFVATVLLQLEAEGKLSLDDTVDTWLPGVVRGNGNDGRKVTVRQLLNHTSGIASYTSDPVFLEHEFTDEFLRHRYDTYTPGQLVAMAMAYPRSSRRGLAGATRTRTTSSPG